MPHTGPDPKLIILTQSPVYGEGNCSKCNSVISTIDAVKNSWLYWTCKSVEDLEDERGNNKGIL